MRRQYEVAFLALSMLCALSIASSSATVSGSVGVICPYNILISAQPNYAIEGNVAASFTIQALAPCNVPIGSNGYLTITDNSNNVVAYQNGITVNEINSVVTTYGIQFPTASLSNDVYKMEVNVISPSYVNSSTVSFQALNPPSVLITNFSVSESNPSAGDSLSFTADITNEGQYATANIPFNLVISGTDSAAYNTVLPALSPYQEENVIIQLSTATANDGSHQATVYGNTIFNGVNIHSTASPTGSNTLTYTVGPIPQPTGGGGHKAPPPVAPNLSISQLPQLAITSAPLYTSLVAGTSTVYSMSFQSTSASTELVSFKVVNVTYQAASFEPPAHAQLGTHSGYLSAPPMAAPGMLHSDPVFTSLPAPPSLVTLSTNSIVLGPGQSSTIDLFFNAPANATPGTYVVPVNVTVNVQNVTHTQAQYLTFVISAPPTQGPLILHQVTLINNTHTASGVIKIIGLRNNTNSSMQLQTLIPEGVASSVSQITAYGAPAIVTAENGFYTINWDIGVLPAGQQIYAYYTVNNPQSQPLLQRVQTTFVLPQAPSPQNLLRVLNIGVPTFYSNYTSSIVVEVLYTGTKAGNVTFALTGPPGIIVRNASQTFSANPNQLLMARFSTTTPSTPGTSLMTLTINSANYTTSYTVPLVALPKQQGAATTTVAQGALPAISITQRDLVVAGGVIAAIIVIYAAARLMGREISGPRYKKERAEQLIRVREQIKRSDQLE